MTHPFSSKHLSIFVPSCLSIASVETYGFARSVQNGKMNRCSVSNRIQTQAYQTCFNFVFMTRTISNFISWYRYLEWAAVHWVYGCMIVCWLGSWSGAYSYLIPSHQLFWPSYLGAVEILRLWLRHYSYCVLVVPVGNSYNFEKSQFPHPTPSHHIPPHPIPPLQPLTHRHLHQALLFITPQSIKIYNMNTLQAKLLLMPCFEILSSLFYSGIHTEEHSAAVIAATVSERLSLRHALQIEYCNDYFLLVGSEWNWNGKHGKHGNGRSK